MSKSTLLDQLPILPQDQDGPTFREPWEAQAFALAVNLSEIGLFTWTEWAAALAFEIKAAQKAGDPDLGDTYYRHWMAALEKLVVAKGLTNFDDLMNRAEKISKAPAGHKHSAENTHHH